MAFASILHMGTKGSLYVWPFFSRRARLWLSVWLRRFGSRDMDTECQNNWLEATHTLKSLFYINQPWGNTKTANFLSRFLQCITSDHFLVFSVVIGLRSDHYRFALSLSPICLWDFNAMTFAVENCNLVQYRYVHLVMLMLITVFLSWNQKVTD